LSEQGAVYETSLKDAEWGYCDFPAHWHREVAIHLSHWLLLHWVLQVFFRMSVSWYSIHWPDVAVCGLEE